MEKYHNIHESLITQSINGSIIAQQELYNLYSRAMFNTSLRIVGNANDAEDVLQEAFLSAFRNLRRYRHQSAFGAWLKRIVINKALTFIKKKRLELLPLEEVDAFEDSEEVINDTFEAYGLTVNEVKEAIQALPEGYRVVFLLYVLEGYDHAEIAEILDITVSTSKSQFNRSKKKLKLLLQEGMSHERQA